MNTISKASFFKGPGMPLLYRGGWNPTLHPRDTNGEFRYNGGRHAHPTVKTGSNQPRVGSRSWIKVTFLGGHSIKDRVQTLEDLADFLKKNAGGHTLDQITISDHSARIGGVNGENVNLSDSEYASKLAEVLKPYLHDNTHITLNGCDTAGEEPSPYEGNYWGRTDPTQSTAGALSAALPNAAITGYQGDRYGWESTGPLIGGTAINFKRGSVVP
jgi:hypothetical protein